MVSSAALGPVPGLTSWESTRPASGRASAARAVFRASRYAHSPTPICDDQGRLQVLARVRTRVRDHSSRCWCTDVAAVVLLRAALLQGRESPGLYGRLECCA